MSLPLELSTADIRSPYSKAIYDVIQWDRIVCVSCIKFIGGAAECAVCWRELLTWTTNKWNHEGLRFCSQLICKQVQCVGMCSLLTTQSFSRKLNVVWAHCSLKGTLVYSAKKHKVEWGECGGRLCGWFYACDRYIQASAVTQCAPSKVLDSWDLNECL